MPKIVIHITQFLHDILIHDKPERNYKISNRIKLDLEDFWLLNKGASLIYDHWLFMNFMEKFNPPLIVGN